MLDIIFSIAKFYPFLKLCNYLCENFADGFVARIQVKLSLTLLIAGVFGFVFECLNAFEYLQGTRTSRTDFTCCLLFTVDSLCCRRPQRPVKEHDLL